jgi:5-methylcytosine-specific restriction protein B
MNSEEYELRGPDAEGRGVFMDNGFLVKAGSLVRREIAPSGKSVVSVHQRLIAAGVLEENGGRLRFAKDHLFDSPSGAAAAVLGRTANGWISWKRADGQTLSKVKRVSRDDRTPMLNDAKRQEIIARHQQLVNDGKLPTQQQLDTQYALFRARFGPSVLAGVNGVPLLTLMHDSGNRDSLVYWLEFKNDHEFETRNFGSIAGGSALKFRIFRRRETGEWQAADKSNYPHDILIEQAIEIARCHRDQLLRGIELLEVLPPNASDDDYAQLQDQMDELAPDVSRLAFGHKYFSMLFPNKLDDYHSPDYQRYHLLKLLQLPPGGDGRYICAGRFVTAAQEVGLSINHFTATLNALQGRRHRYWRVGTTTGKTSNWQIMRDRSCVAVGWSKLGDIAWIEAKQPSREKLKKLLEVVYPNQPSTIDRDCSQLTQFVALMMEGDVVLAAEGKSILGIGRVVGGYEYHAESEFPHQRQVEWLTFDEWQLPESIEGLQSTVREIGKVNENILGIERRIQSPKLVNLVPELEKSLTPTNRLLRLTGIPGRIQSILERKGQVVLYGPPGTGKTYWAERTATDLAALSAFGILFDSLNDDEKNTVIGKGNTSGFVRLCCFHPAYGYEDFLEGYRPRTVNGQVSFELRDGVFKKLCKDADSSPDRDFYLIVDEINRGDIPRIFGELLTTLEKDKRGKRIILPLSQEIFSVPRNVFLLGTMNTADRSISLLDAALRRRFGFVEMMPDGSVLKDSAVEGIPLRAWLEAINRKIREHVGRDARNLQLGHSYLMHSGGPLKDVASLKRAIRDDIIPLLEEYCYEDYSTLGAILGEQIVDLAAERVRHELFEDGQEDALIQGLLAPFPDISTSSEAISSEESLAGLDEDHEETDS